VKTREWKIEDGGWNTRSVLSVFTSFRRDRVEAGGEGGECGSPLPLFDRCKDSALQSASRRRAVAALWRAAKAEGLAQSKTWRHFMVLTLLALSTLILQPSTASAQSYSIDWYRVAGGGGTSTGDAYQVSGTIGQHDAGGPMTGGNYSLTGGFWALISVVQTPGAPWLTITHSGDSVMVSWPSSFTGWTLQQNANLATAGWTPTSYYIVNIDGTNSITITPPMGNLFFRLAK
jgi:hypothetical protein